MTSAKEGDVVVPGDMLCVIEEMLPGYGTYEIDGVVYAATPGTVALDLKKRSISILAHNGKMKLALPVKGDIIIGEVITVYDQNAEVAIAKRNDMDVHNQLVGEINISNVTRRYIKSMHDVLSPRDIVRAAALNTHKIPPQLTLVGPNLGVIYATCKRCGNALTLTTHNNLVCLRCENHETREVANDYGQRFGLVARPDLEPRRVYGHYGTIRRHDGSKRPKDGHYHGEGDIKTSKRNSGRTTNRRRLR